MKTLKEKVELLFQEVVKYMHDTNGTETSAQFAARMKHTYGRDAIEIVAQTYPWLADPPKNGI